MDKNLPRWIFQSVAEYFRPVAEDLSLPYFVEGIDERSEETMHSNHVELRVTGPTLKEVSNGYYTVDVVINFIFTKAMDPVDNNAYDLIQWTGVFADEMLLPIPVYKKGMGLEDNGTLLGCLQIGKGKNEAARIYHFGQLDKDTAVRQSEVDAVFTMDYTGRELGESRVTPVNATASILAMASIATHALSISFNESVSSSLSLTSNVNSESVKVSHDVMSLVSELSLTFIANKVIETPLGISDSVARVIDHAFVSTWNTEATSIGSSNTYQAALPLESDGTYNFVVQWGDGNQDTITAFGDAAKLHTYTSPGVYDIIITGQLEGWRFNSQFDRLKIGNISSWGTLEVGNNDSCFQACDNLTTSAPDILNLSDVTDLESSFHGCPLFNPATIGSWVTANATTMKSMFRNCDVFNQDIGSWSTSNVIDMTSMFNGADNFNQDIGSWNTANVTLMISMLQFCVDFDQDIGSWNIESVTNMSNMFNGSGLSTPNYDSTLIGWAAQTVQTGVNFNGGSATYSEGTANAARETLLASSWVITDGGLA
jgi:surface protein